MEIQINSQPVDFEIEHEQSVPDIMESVSQWARQRNLIFTEAMIDDDVYTIETVPDVPLGDVTTINCIVQSSADIVLSTIQEAVEYIKRINDFIQESLKSGAMDMTKLPYLAQGTVWLSDVVDKTGSLLNMDVHAIRYRDSMAGTYFETLDAFSSSLMAVSDDKAALALLTENAELFSSLSEIFKIMLISDNMKTLILQSIESPDVIIAAIADIRDKLPMQLKNIEEAAIAYQTGKDDEGADKIQGFIDFIYQYLRSCHQIEPLFSVSLADIVVDDESMENKNNAINDLLNEIIDVLEANDIISLADILEYELIPVMENLDRYCEALLDNLGNA
ncbi:MAG TPA: hypothetical protein PK544_09690 [Spirochaetota bacterium]|nr:hypothetical protein [Spirochaetota bacterium]